MVGEITIKIIFFRPSVNAEIRVIQKHKYLTHKIACKLEINIKFLEIIFSKIFIEYEKNKSKFFYVFWGYVANFIDYVIKN